tara:strand:+ start:218 stop:403 length:186 start_codon:yes stop_codon:yes gene_type:complete
MGGYDNQTSRELSHQKYKSKHISSRLFKGWYEDYINNPSHQYLMTFKEYKKKRLKSKGNWK